MYFNKFNFIKLGNEGAGTSVETEEAPAHYTPSDLELKSFRDPSQAPGFLSGYGMPLLTGAGIAAGTSVALPFAVQALTSGIPGMFKGDALSKAFVDTMSLGANKLVANPKTYGSIGALVGGKSIYDAYSNVYKARRAAEKRREFDDMQSGNTKLLQELAELGYTPY
jgi:hypothetical protein